MPKRYPIQHTDPTDPTNSTEATPSDSKLHLLQLRLPLDTIAQIDALINKRRVKPSRHTWFLEAIYEKIDKDSLS